MVKGWTNLPNKRNMEQVGYHCGVRTHVSDVLEYIGYYSVASVGVPKNTIISHVFYQSRYVCSKPLNTQFHPCFMVWKDESGVARATVVKNWTSLSEAGNGIHWILQCVRSHVSGLLEQV